MAGPGTVASPGPSVLDPIERTKMEAFVGATLRDAKPEVLQMVINTSKNAGNAAFKEKRYAGRPFLQHLAPTTCNVNL